MRLGAIHTTPCGCLRLAAHLVEGASRPYHMTCETGDARAASFASRDALEKRRGDMLAFTADRCCHCEAIDIAYLEADRCGDADLITAALGKHLYRRRQGVER